MMSNNKLQGLIRLFRPELSFAAGICVVAGEILALGVFRLLAICLSDSCAAFSCQVPP